MYISHTNHNWPRNSYCGRLDTLIVAVLAFLFFTSPLLVLMISYTSVYIISSYFDTTLYRLVY
jgi:hypothetical protein